MNNKYYLYRHIRLDKNEPFYIGIGSKCDNYTQYSMEYRRAFCKKRNNLWSKIAKKTPYRVEILLESNDLVWLRLKEIEFIRLYGRKNLKTGSLANLTDGGEHNFGQIVSSETRVKMSLAKKGKDFMTQEWKDTRIKAVILALSKKIIQKTKDGIFVKEWNSITEAARYYNVTDATISGCCRKKQKTSCGYLWEFS